MKDSQIDRPSDPSGAPRPGRNGVEPGPTALRGRSHLLRRETRFPFRGIEGEADTIRLRRERRVSATFSAIHALARSGRNGHD